MNVETELEEESGWRRGEEEPQPKPMQVETQMCERKGSRASICVCVAAAVFKHNLRMR